MTQRGPWEQRLQDYGLNGAVGTVAQVETLWRLGQETLSEVARLLREAGGTVSAGLEGEAADRATQAIEGAAGVCEERGETFARGAGTLGQSGTALSAAQREFAAMGEPPALSLTPFDPDSTPRQDLQRQAANEEARGAHAGAMAAREERARAAVQAVEGQYDDSTRVLNQIAGYTPPEGETRGMDTQVYGGAGAPAGGAGGSSGGAGGGGHHVGFSGVGTYEPHHQQTQPPHPTTTHPQPPTTQPPTTEPPTVEPPHVTVPPGTEPAGPTGPGTVGPGAGGGIGAPQGPALPAGAVGGGAGVAPAASASSAAGLAGAVGGALVGGTAALGGLRGGVLGAAGASTGRGAAVRGIGATTRAASSGALGRPATAGGTVGRQATTGGRAGAGVRGAATGATGTRGAATGATGTRGQSGTRGAGGSRGAGQGGTRGGARIAGTGAAGGRRTGRNEDEKAQQQQYIEDERDWIDDEDAGPGVLG